MDVTNKQATPAHLFERAKRSFAAGDFEIARSQACEVDALVAGHAEVTGRGSIDSPHYSIVVVTYRDVADVGEAFSQLSPYAHDDQYEIIVVNNGNAAARSLSDRFFETYKITDVGFNYGCSGGRNLGARAARGEFLIFVDDDGVIERGAIERLIEVTKDRKAVMVRGRMIPKSQAGIGAKHYDLGDEIICAGPNAEGLLACRREEFLTYGGFDTLLTGHEGWALCSKMYPSHGPGSFLYAPNAVIRHDYASDAQHAIEKRSKFSKNDGYLSEYYPLALALRLSFKNPESAQAKEVLRLKERVKTLEKRLGDFREASRASEVVRLKEKVKTLEKRSRDFRKASRASAERAQKSERAYREMKQDCSRTQQAYREMKQDCSRTQQAYRQIQMSTSWRITAPLRRIASLLRSRG